MRIPRRLAAFIAVQIAAVALTAVSGSLVEVEAAGQSWAARDLAAVEARGVPATLGAGRLASSVALTRAEFVGLVLRNLEPRFFEGTPVVARGLFRDLPRSHPLAREVTRGWELGLVKGYEGTFWPDRRITRAEAVVILTRALPVKPPLGRYYFTDQASIPGWALVEMARAASAGLIQGYPNGTFRPLASITGAEAAALVRRLLEVLGKAYDLRGVVREYDPAGGILVIRGLQENQDSRVKLASQAGIFRNGTGARRTDIAPLDEANLLLDSSGLATMVDLEYRDAGGKLLSVDAGRRTLRYQDSQGLARSRVLLEGAPVYRQGRPASLDDLEAGDSVYLVLSARNTVRFVEAVRFTHRGYLLSVLPSESRLLISLPGGGMRYLKVSDGAVIVRNGRKVNLASLRAGDYISLYLNEAVGAITYLETTE
ncbi:MAG: S-layer homology domain-containing protein [Firmicutes bacterium]|nr:S-layer homology domain-containing protein [Bacillota bacterium]